MNSLCFSTNLTSTELASWVQAIGTIVAVLAAATIAVWQSSRQHQNALTIHREERRHAHLEQAKTLLTLCQNCSKATKHFASEMCDRESIHLIATQEKYLDFGELQSLQNATSNLPLHSLPSNLITHAMVLGASIRQFKYNIDTAMQLHRKMDVAQFEYFLKILKEINASLALTCSDIEKAVNEIKSD
jgi:hypothetical protein